MSRFLDELHSRARHAAGCNAGYRLAGENGLARAASLASYHLKASADALEDLARLEKLSAEEYARCSS
jgi:hypothetical protein